MASLNLPDVRWKTNTTSHEKFYITGEEFHSSIVRAKSSNPYGSFVHAYPQEKYDTMKVFLMNDGAAGVAVTKDGDIVSVFKHPDCKIKAIVPRYLLPMAIGHGGDHLDCFNSVLPSMYAEVGFIPVAKIKFNDDFAPERWNYERDGRPDIIFMVYDKTKKQNGELVNSQIKSLEYSETYEEAQAIQERVLRSIKR